MRNIDALCSSNCRLAREKWDLSRAHPLIRLLKTLSKELGVSLAAGDLTILQNGWYVTHAGLLRVAHRKHCHAITILYNAELSDPRNRRFAFEATVYKSRICKGFMGFGDADPSNVSPLVHGAEMRVAETRAVNRALRKLCQLNSYMGSREGVA